MALRRINDEQMQLALGISVRDDPVFDNFYKGPNEAIVSQIKKAVMGHGERIIYCYGPSGSGCTHLLQAACHFAHQHQITSQYLALGSLLTDGVGCLADIERLQVVTLDDVDTIAGNAMAEEALFDAYNRLRAANRMLILTGKQPPNHLGIMLPDLCSRLGWGLVYRVKPLADQEMVSALQMRAHRKGMRLADEVASFLIKRYPRDMGKLSEALEILDNASLIAQRTLTIPFLKETLNI